MQEMKPNSSWAVVIGDIVASRRAPDRAHLHATVEEALQSVNARVPAVAPLAITVGDEFQGIYATLGAAIEATFRVRLALLPGVDTRYGIGRGASTVLDADRGIYDGPAWWAARTAIEVAAGGGKGALGGLRTTYRIAPDAQDLAEHGGSNEELAVNASLLCRDHLVGSVSTRSLRLLRGLMDGQATQAALAAQEGISASAVSQRIRADGLGVILEAQAFLGALT